MVVVFCALVPDVLVVALRPGALFVSAAPATHSAFPTSAAIAWILLL